MKGKAKTMRLAGIVEALYSNRIRLKGRKAALIHITAVLTVGLALISVFSGSSGAGVATTKHNFGSMSPAEIKTTSTSEICIFCHASHNNAPSIAMWNRTVPGDIYDIYASQSIVATQGQPTGSSKLCLSCHDGTIALGQLLNIPGSGQTAPLGGTLPVTGPVDRVTPEGKIATTSASYIGTNLKDDHPISFLYSASYPSNVEIKSSSSFPAGMKLDSLGKLQCTSCHDPHGTNYPKFMVATLENAQLCTACHDQRYWNTMPAVHRDSTATWNGTGVNPWHVDLGNTPDFTDDTPQMQGCLACHRSHGGASGKDLLKGTNPATNAIEDEEWTCLNCHNGNAAAKAVEPEFSYASRHDVKGYYGKHTPSRSVPNAPVREERASLGYNNSTNRHVECVDCHNAHAAKSGNHTVGGITGNVIGANLLGGWGTKVMSPWPAAGTAATSYSVVDFTMPLVNVDNIEGYLCMKCHSYYAYGNTPPSVPSGNPYGTQAYESDITADFNINNMGFHPVFAQGQNKPPVGANPNWPANNLGLTNTFRYVQYVGTLPGPGFYNVSHTSTGTCTDCHGSDISTDPQGAHGSGQKWMLRKNETGVGTAANFCYNCHRRDVYGDENYVPATLDAGGKLIRDYSRVKHPVDGTEGASLFYGPGGVGSGTGNDSNRFGILCLSCHGGAYDTANNVMKGIHGSNAGAGTLAGSDSLGYRMMNGACVESYIRPNTATVRTTMNFRVVNVSTDKVCTANFTNFNNGNYSNYNCTNILDCSY